MKRLATVLIGLLAAGLATTLTLSCSTRRITGADMQGSAIAKTPLYEYQGIAVYRMPNRPSELAVRMRAVGVADKAGKIHVMSWDEAVRTVDNSTRVILTSTWRTIPVSAFDPASGIKPGARFAYMMTDPGATDGGGTPPDPGCGGCWCCVPIPGGCSCTWGCIQACYR